MTVWLTELNPFHSPGDQHATTIANPFEVAQPRISEYTAQEIATLQSRLEKQLGPEYLSARTGPSGQKVHYIAAEKCIALANEVFGFNGWSSTIKEIQVDFVDEHPQTLKISLGLSVIVRVTLRDGTFHEDVGYGHIENCAGKAKAFEKAKKEGTTDGLKRALRNFGNVLGNCIYDKDYVKKVTKLKVEPNRVWDESGLHRHADFVKKEELVKVEPGTSGSGAGGAATVTTVPSADESFEDLLGEFDEVDFNMMDDDHPDEVSVPQSEKPTPQSNGNKPNLPGMQPPSRPLSRSHSAGNPARPPQTLGQAYPRPHPQHNPNQATPRPQHPLQQQMAQPRSASGSNGPHQTPPPQAQAQNGAASSEGVGFFSARAVKQFAGSKGDEEPKLPTAPLGAQAFNPHAESPSIRKTPGIDHTKSKPVARNGQHVAPAEGNEGESSGPNTSNGGGQQQGPMAGQRGNVVNPQLSQARRIGAPVGPGGPVGNRGQYRPPTIKRPLPNEGANGAARPALADVSTNGTVIAVPAGGLVGGDPKRQKMG
ncbi:recombination protein Rad52 [Cryphonectria parasitica EP155]|uniref:RAD52 homolog n=1 Tax=Cryphonectria parasitica (strain ATCC 38755 / EP155) TaxID=660469 RepID=A0A9P4XSL0_CRYP1|nr:recombination protein Rad52 [Cryphonectria parasitica EP155]KAF3760569.1 recombination protein Rad52 [Cryphonectria parasitica EP155]